jgi:hypothetical protein
MLGALLGALVSAPLAATAAVSKGTGEALQMGGKDIPLLNAAGETLSAAGDMALAGAGGFQKSMSELNIGGSLADLGRGMMGGISSSLTPGSQQVSQSLSRAVEQPKLTTEFCVSAADLGCFSPTAVGGVKSDGVGMGV